MRKGSLTLAAALVLLIALLVLVQQTVLGAGGTTRCVAPGGAGGCLALIQDAIDASSAGDDITVAAGTYNEQITLKDGVSIYGQGWDKTIIDGGFSGSSTVMVPWDVSASTVLSGVQVTGGGTGDPATSLNGGGIHVSGSPRIVNTFVYSCTGTYGGGVYVELGSPTFENVPAWDNRAQYGGGFYLGRDAEVTITGNPFDGINGTVWANVALSEGGGICVKGATVALAGLRIYWNRAYIGGGVHVGNTPQRVSLVLNDISGNQASYGGGISAHTSTRIEMLANAVGTPLFGVWGNTATAGGGGASFFDSAGLVQGNWFLLNQATTGWGGGMSIWGADTTWGTGTADLLIAANWFEGNGASSGAGLQVYSGAAPWIDANTVISNNGGGINLFEAGWALVTNNIIAHNLPFGAVERPGVALFKSPGQVVNNTIAGNHGYGVYLEKAEGAVLVNNIISSNTDDGIHLVDTTDYMADYNNLYDNPYVGLPVGANDRSIDSQFVAAGNLGEAYHIQSTSPVKDSGWPVWAPWYDIDGDWRAFGGSVSMGADEIATGEERPAIAVAKTANAATARVGETVTYAYRLTNTGNVGFGGVAARDDRLGDVPLAVTYLAPGAVTTGSLTYTVTGGDLPGPLANTVIATGTVFLSDPVTDAASLELNLTAWRALVYLPLVVKSGP